LDAARAGRTRGQHGRCRTSATVACPDRHANTTAGTDSRVGCASAYGRSQQGLRSTARLDSAGSGRPVTGARGSAGGSFG
jgi:hypothetical protein